MDFRPGMSPQEYEQWRAEIEQMHADYEAIDQAEYAEFMDQMDARDAQKES